MSKDLFGTKLLDTLPSSIASDPQVQAMAKSLDAEFLAVSKCISQCIILPAIGTITDPDLLQLLANQFHVDFWQDILAGGPPSIEKQQQLILNSLEWHTYKGTKWLVEEALKTVFVNFAVTEWWEYGGNPYFFQAIVDDPTGIDPAAQQRAYDAIMATKNARSWMEAFIRRRHFTEQLYIGLALMQWVTVDAGTAEFRVKPPSVIKARGLTYQGLGRLDRVTNKISAPPYP